MSVGVTDATEEEIESGRSPVSFEEELGDLPLLSYKQLDAVSHTSVCSSPPPPATEPLSRSPLLGSLARFSVTPVHYAMPVSPPPRQSGELPSQTSSSYRNNISVSLQEKVNNTDRPNSSGGGQRSRLSIAAIGSDIVHGLRRTAHRQAAVPRSLLNHALPKRSGWGVQTFRAHQRSFVVIEVFHGRHRIHEWQCGDLLKAIHKDVQVSAAANSGLLTYRDCRQVFSDIARPIPSIEIRRHCVVVCLPPVMGFVLHNKVYLLFIEELRGDSLIQHLVELTKVHSTAALGKAMDQSAAGQGGDVQTPAKSGGTKDSWRESRAEAKKEATEVPTAEQQEEASSLERPRLSVDAGGTKDELVDAGGTNDERPQIHRTGDKFSSVVAEGWELAAADTTTSQTFGSASEGLLCTSLYPFEYGAIECLISASFDQLHIDISDVEHQLEVINTKVKKRLSPSALLLEDLHSVKNPIALYDDRVTAFDKVLNELLSNPGDMSRMALSRLNEELLDLPQTAIKAAVVDADLEIMLEYFDQEMDQFTERVGHMREIVSNTERLISLRLALMRNKLIYLELAATILATGIAVGTCVTGIFGMNLQSGMEESHTSFLVAAIAVSVISVASLFVVAYVMYSIRL
eukprot:GHVS01053224.1.p1 GENE.GHVS01053224.1~~GHVS01053224.1.p1  ORF type:complete len:631 (+),score=100.73 GHVS01053224.1:157-2049(+)